MTIAILDARDKEYVVVAAGADLIATYVQQAIAAGQAAQDVLDAILAAGLSEGVFPSLAAGEAGTTDGQYFWVGEGGTVTLYLNDSGTGSEIAELATMAALATRPTFAELAADAGASLIGTADGSDVQSFLTFYENTSLYSSRFPTLSAALTAWGAKGGELIIDADHTIPAPGGGVTFQAISLQLLANRGYVLGSREARQILYTGPTPVRSMLMILGANKAPLHIEGVTWDANTNANKPLFIDYQGVQGANRDNIDVSGSFLNAYSGTAGWGDITALKIVGGFNAVYVHDVVAENIGRAAGVTDPGSNGSSGITLFGAGLNNYRSAVIERCRVANIYTADGIDSPNYADMDGILCFQEIEAGTRAPQIRDCTVIDSPGRAIKMYAPNADALAENIAIVRSTVGAGNGQPGGPGHSVDIDFQQGDGTIRNISITYSGNAHYTLTTPIQVAQVNARTSGNRLGPTIIEGVRINDTTSSGIKGCVISVLDGVGGEARNIRVADVVDAGLSETLIRTNKLGNTARASIKLERIECDVSVAATRTSDLTPLLFVQGTEIVNRNATVRPVKVTLANAMSVLDWGDWVGDETIRGFARYTGGYRGNAIFSNGFRGPGGGVESAPIYGKSEASGRVAIPMVTLAAGATWTGPSVGLYQSAGGDFVVSLRLNGGFDNDYGRWRCNAGGTGFVALDALSGANIEVTNGGADTGTSGKVVLWKAGSTTQLLKVSNHTASAINFSVVYNG